MILWSAGLLLAAILMVEWGNARSARLEAASIGPGQSHAVVSPGRGSGGNAPNQSATGPNASILGRLEIPAIKLSVPVVDNYDTAALLRGVGRIGETAEPGGLGNFVVAGHRDTFFRPLRNIQRGMEMKVVTPEGSYRYQVDRTEIVLPDHLGVMDIGERPEMTLITCFPFDYIGAAPKRFVVHAHLVSLAPGEN